MPFLTPSVNRRWNEFTGLLWMALAVLGGLSLATFSPADPSFNTAPAASGEVRNWAGAVGAYAADLLYQLCGACAFLFPLMFAWIGWLRFRSRELSDARAKVSGAVLFLFSMMTALALIPDSIRLYDLFPPGGLGGILMAGALRRGLNGPGTAILLVITSIASLYLLTTFSVEHASRWLRQRFGWIGRLQQKWEAWKRSRAARTVKTIPMRVPLAEPHPMPHPPPSAREAFDAEKPRPAGVVIPITLPVQEPSHPAARSARLKPAHHKSGGYKLPPTGLLHPPIAVKGSTEDDLKRLAMMLTAKCEEFDVRGSVTQINPGPVVTTFEFKPEAGVKYNRITNLVEDLCLALEAESILIERIPGKSTVGVEVPNANRETIVLREILESEAFASSRSPLTMALGKEINGRIRVAELTSMPHLLIAGSTGSGKSVSMNSLILSILFKATPEEVKLILVDPKRLELGLYEGIPHLVTPIITDPKVAANALRNAVREMERRLKLLAEKGVRNIEQYNRLFEREETPNLFEHPGEHAPLPLIVIFIDELADLMMVDSSNVETSITRLAQMARAVGIHLVLATQRPSVDVITGLIKANFPARISFRVATKVDSRTILDSNGSEALLGKGDMLYSPPGSGRLVRVHGAFVTESEITQVVEFWRAQATPSYSEEFLQPPPSEDNEEEAWTGERDEAYEEAVRVVVEMGKASTSILQRRLRLGYGRAARLLDIMEKDGIIGPPDGSKPREVLKRPDWIEEYERSRADA
ncbi:MAG: DNA translocase FtsK [Terriglobia bacterium]